MEDFDSSTHLQRLLDLLQTGDNSAPEALITYALDRCHQLARRMFRRHRDLHTLDETDDVLQAALLRLHRALLQVKPTTVPGFFGLVAQQIRWVLGDLARKHGRAKVVTYTGPCGLGDGPQAEGPLDTAGEPASLLEWTHLHDAIEHLPEEERQIFDLLLYQGLSQNEAAAILELSVRTVKRRWQRARLMLHRALGGHWPEQF